MKASPSPCSAVPCRKALSRAAVSPDGRVRSVSTVNCTPGTGEYTIPVGCWACCCCCWRCCSWRARSAASLCCSASYACFAATALASVCCDCCTLACAACAASASFCSSMLTNTSVVAACFCAVASWARRAVASSSAFCTATRAAAIFCMSCLLRSEMWERSPCRSSAVVRSEALITYSSGLSMPRTYDALSMSASCALASAVCLSRLATWASSAAICASMSATCLVSAASCAWAAARFCCAAPRSLSACACCCLAFCRFCCACCTCCAGSPAAAAGMTGMARRTVVRTAAATRPRTACTPWGDMGAALSHACTPKGERVNGSSSQSCDNRSDVRAGSGRNVCSPCAASVSGDGATDHVVQVERLGDLAGVHVERAVTGDQHVEHRRHVGGLGLLAGLVAPAPRVCGDRLPGVKQDHAGALRGGHHAGGVAALAAEQGEQPVEVEEGGVQAGEAGGAAKRESQGHRHGARMRTHGDLHGRPLLRRRQAQRRVHPALALLDVGGEDAAVEEGDGVLPAVAADQLGGAGEAVAGEDAEHAGGVGEGAAEAGQARAAGGKGEPATGCGGGSALGLEAASGCGGGDDSRLGLGGGLRRRHVLGADELGLGGGLGEDGRLGGDGLWLGLGGGDLLDRFRGHRFGGRGLRQHLRFGSRGFRRCLGGRHRLRLRLGCCKNLLPADHGAGWPSSIGSATGTSSSVAAHS